MRVIPFAAGLIALALLGACGDDDSEDTAPASTDQPTEQETTVSPTSKPEPPSSLPGATTGPSPSTAPTSGETKPPPDTSAPSPTTTTPSPGSFPASVQARIDAAIADLAGRQGVDATAITVADAREVTWSDSSLGCPEPGRSYMQVLTSGFLLVLDVNGRLFEYHGGTSGDLFLCENPRPPVPGGVGST